MGPWERRFTSTESADYLNVVLKAPGGSERSVDGFWDGENVWKVRFMPDEAGVWTFRTSAEPSASGLDGIEGSFEAVESRKTRIDSSTTVSWESSENRRHLAHADETPSSGWRIPHGAAR